MRATALGRIVVAEHDPLVRKDLREMLLQLGYEVVGEAADGSSALNLTRSCRPDAVLLDAKMPNMSGIKVAGAISREQLAPVLIVTGFTARELAQQAAEAGAAAFLVKPFSEGGLLAAMEVARERFRAAAALRQEVRRLREEAETDKLVRQAKAVVMDEYGIGEAEAMVRIETLAAKSGKAIREAASAIVLAARTRV